MIHRMVLLLVAAGIVIVTIGIGGQVFSQQDETVPPEVLATPLPLPDDVDLDAGIEIGPPLPTPEPMEIEPVPTATPIGAAPQPAAVLSSDQVAFEAAFDSADVLDGWDFGQIFRDPVNPPAWQIRDDRLVAPDNTIRSMYLFNDTLAVSPATLSGDGSVEVNTLTGTASQVGLVANYSDDQNFVAMILAATNAPGGARLEIVEFVAGQPNVLAEDTDLALEYDRWYSLSLATQGNTLRATVDGKTLLTTTLSEQPDDNRVGVYAGSEGYAYFDNLRLVSGE